MMEYVKLGRTGLAWMLCAKLRRAMVKDGSRRRPPRPVAAEPSREQCRTAEPKRSITSSETGASTGSAFSIGGEGNSPLSSNPPSSPSRTIAA